MDLTVTLRLLFNPALSLGDSPLETYKTAVMNANQGTLELKVIPVRTAVGGA
jgi:hypothetical protein